jgi:5-hydroxyisourate hydrolase
MSPITTHVLDTAQGKPAAGIRVSLHVQASDGWKQVGQGVTNRDGRIADLLPGAQFKSGTYQLKFETASYLAQFTKRPFFPEVTIVFHVHDAEQHCHVPLLLSPYGYSTYRGS